MTEQSQVRPQCVWHPVWSKPRQKEIIITLQQRFNERAINSELNEPFFDPKTDVRITSGVGQTVNDIYYYANMEDIVAAYQFMAHQDVCELEQLDLIADGIFIYENCVLASDPADKMQTIMFVTENAIRSKSHLTEQYSPGHQCTLLVGSACYDM